jgi:vacuolar-type H+-ATPase subunit I/STV1
MVKDISENEPLESIAKRIAECANQADEKVLQAARLIREARKRVEAGQAGDIKWYPWAETNIKLSKSRLRELLNIAEAEDSKKELERLRGLNNARQTRYRNNNKAKGTAPLRNGGTETKVVSEPIEAHMVPPANGTADSIASEEPERAGLIAWARKAPIEHVGEVLSFAKKLESATRDKKADQITEQAAA